MEGFQKYPIFFLFTSEKKKIWWWGFREELNDSKIQTSIYAVNLRRVKRKTLYAFIHKGWDRSRKKSIVLRVIRIFVYYKCLLTLLLTTLFYFYNRKWTRWPEVQNLDKAIRVSLGANSFEKGMNLSAHSPFMNIYLGRLNSLASVR